MYVIYILYVYIYISYYLLSFRADFAVVPILLVRTQYRTLTNVDKYLQILTKYIRTLSVSKQIRLSEQKHAWSAVNGILGPLILTKY